MKKVFIISMTVFLLLLIVSCTDDPYRPIVSGDFVYSTVGVYEKGTAAIIGLSEEGKRKETIVFPTYIDGYRVTTIGTNFVNKPSDPIIFDYAKNIYFHSQHGIPITYFIYEYIDTLEDTISIFVGGDYIEGALYGPIRKNDVKNHIIFASKTSIDQIDDPTSTFNYEYANVGYYLGVVSSDPFFVDDADGTKVNVIPPVPYKEGYEFKGWYKDLAYQAVWDFENDIVPAKLYDAEGNYQFNETKIYAKWEKI